MTEFLQTGTVMTLLHEKGYGFIKGDDGIQHFFHRSNVDDFDHLAKGSPALAVTIRDQETVS